MLFRSLVITLPKVLDLANYHENNQTFFLFVFLFNKIALTGTMKPELTKEYIFNVDDTKNRKYKIVPMWNSERVVAFDVLFSTVQSIITTHLKCKLSRAKKKQVRTKRNKIYRGLAVAW